MSPHEELQQLEPPPEVFALGQPEKAVLLTRHCGSVHSPLARWLSDVHLVAACSLMALAVFFGAMGMLSLHKKAPVTVLQITFGGGIACLAIGAGFMVTRKSGTSYRHVHHAYGFYPEALVYFQQGKWKVIRWTDIVEYVGPWPGSSDARVKLRDGTELKLLRGFWADTSMLMEVERRSLVPLMERATAAFSAG